ncbi:MAG TPA: hypothetical protein VMT86_02195 [Bryobacteraceae bacterium]|nr:hypothetical protein [Bryobacteraceae bacterium]
MAALALGAQPQRLLVSVLRETCRVIAIGVIIGLPASLLLARMAESELYGIRAMRIEPVTALRHG